MECLLGGQGESVSENNSLGHPELNGVFRAPWLINNTRKTRVENGPVGCATGREIEARKFGTECPCKKRTRKSFILQVSDLV